MSKIKIIIQREFSTRIRKKSFIIMSILGPFLFAAIAILPMWFATMQTDEVKKIAIVDQSKSLYGKIKDNQTLKFTQVKNIDISELRTTFQKLGYWGVLYIPENAQQQPNSIELISKTQPNLSTKQHIQNSLEKEIEREKLLTYNIQDLDKILKSVKTNVSLRTISLEDDGKAKESSTEVSMIVGYASGFLIYLFIFLFGTQVMRGVIEEKTNRIVEVIVSSVKPFELMMGKIIGIGAVGLLQFLIWTVLTTGIIGIAQNALFSGIKSNNIQANSPMGINPAMNSTLAQTDSQQPLANNNSDKAKEIFEAIHKLNFMALLAAFLFYFIGGFLLYGSLFAAVGSAVDNETDTQQFMLPITIPLILAIYVMISTINNPDSSLSFWFSIIPLTSPIVMMVRIPFGVPAWELALSASLLVASFIGTTWLAGKIYRTGILMYGKKVSYSELWKWIKYRG
jgi:ABC-2 type transport system permease protein